MSSRTHAAANSIASGSPSSRAQIAATADSFCAVKLNPGLTACARSTNSAIAASGTPSGGTSYACSAERCRTSRLVTMTRSPSDAPSRSPTSGAALMTCSKLSRMSSTALVRRYPERSPRVAVGFLAHAQRERDGRHDSAPIARLLQRDEENAIREVGQCLTPGGQGQPRLAGYRPDR